MSAPGAKEQGRTAADQEEPLDEEQSTKYRALVARCNQLSPDRPDIAFSVEELARNMTNPKRGDWTRLRRPGRYLIVKPRSQQRFNWQPSQHCISRYTDADLAGCRDARKATTGGVIAMGSHTLEGWSKTQALIALSSGESELYATLKASAETLGVISMLSDFGLKVSRGGLGGCTSGPRDNKTDHEKNATSRQVCYGYSKCLHKRSYSMARYSERWTRQTCTQSTWMGSQSSSIWES